MLELLGEHYRHIDALLSEGEAAINSTDPARAKTLALVRWQLMRRLRAYQLFKHTELFGPVIRGNDPEKAKSAEAMKARCTGIGEAYNAHVGKWSAGGIESDWCNYEADAAEITRSIRNHLARELAEADKLLSVPLRPALPARSVHP